MYIVCHEADWQSLIWPQAQLFCNVYLFNGTSLTLATPIAGGALLQIVSYDQVGYETTTAAATQTQTLYN